MPGRNLRSWHLTCSGRDEIALGRAAGELVRMIATRIGRSPSTVSREVQPDAA